MLLTTIGILILSFRPYKFCSPNEKKEKGCVDPLYGKKTKCIIRIIPKEVKTPTLKIDKNCKKFN